MDERDQVLTTLRNVFGLEAFREGQRDIIDSILAGRDVIAVMPTGGGKSLCYQLPAMLLPGLTLVVSPLIALMKDQVDQLQSQGLPATLINSTLSPEEQRRRLEHAAAGGIKLLYVAPERFRSPRFLQALASTDVSLFAVDEAHCLSQWGHDFRPDYLRLPRAIAALGRPPVAAFTATATSDVRADIARNLHLVEPQTFFAGIDRDNLFVRFEYPEGKGEQDQKVRLIVKEIKKRKDEQGIIYASTRKNVERISQRLKDLGLSVMPYHAGMDEAERTRAQDDFMRGASQVIVATNAFGMGVDKADIRFVIHHDFPGSVEAYYQEVGRAGRDGQEALCLTLFSERDRFIQDFFLAGSNPSREVIERVHAFLVERGEERVEMTVAEIAEALPDIGNGMAIATSLKILERFSVIDRGFRGESPARIRLKVDVARLMERLERAPIQRAVAAALEEVADGDLRAGASLDLGHLAYESGLTREQVSRVLTELGRMSSVDYEPPFRGRATRVLIRDEALPIDWDLLAEKARRDRMKIDTMVLFARSGACRKWFLRRYFMDEGGALSCGCCDRCVDASDADLENAARRTERELERIRQGHSPRLRRRARSGSRPTGNQASDASPLSGDRLLMVRKILACIARMRGRFGRLRVAQVLKGSRDKDLLRWDLDRLSTYGILADLRLDDIVALIDELIDAGFVRTESIETANRYPIEVIALSDRGREAMHDRIPVILPWPAGLCGEGRDAADGERQRESTKRHDASSRKRNSTRPDDLSADERTLFHKLSAWRRHIARQEGVPLYVVMNNETMNELARRCPLSLDALFSIRGMGKTRVSRYGQALVALCLEHSRTVAG